MTGHEIIVLSWQGYCERRSGIRSLALVVPHHLSGMFGGYGTNGKEGMKNSNFRIVDVEGGTRIESL